MGGYRINGRREKRGQTGVRLKRPSSPTKMTFQPVSMPPISCHLFTAKIGDEDVVSPSGELHIRLASKAVRPEYPAMSPMPGVVRPQDEASLPQFIALPHQKRFARHARLLGDAKPVAVAGQDLAGEHLTTVFDVLAVQHDSERSAIG